VVLLRNLLISYHVRHGMKEHFFNGYTFLSGWDWVFLAAESLWEGTMGWMDQGRLKETQGLNPCAWNAHLYIWSDCFSWFGTPWTSLWHLSVKMPTCWSTLWTLHSAPFLPHFFIDHSCIVSHVILLYFLVEFLSNRCVVCQEEYYKKYSPWDT
jgi:hypothetical protein